MHVDEKSIVAIRIYIREITNRSLATSEIDNLRIRAWRKAGKLTHIPK